MTNILKKIQSKMMMLQILAQKKKEKAMTEESQETQESGKYNGKRSVETGKVGHSLGLLVFLRPPCR